MYDSTENWKVIQQRHLMLIDTVQKEKNYYGHHQCSKGERIKVMNYIQMKCMIKFGEIVSQN